MHNGVGILVLRVSLVGHPFPESTSAPIYQIWVFQGVGAQGLPTYCPALLQGIWSHNLGGLLAKLILPQIRSRSSKVVP